MQAISEQWWFRGQGVIHLAFNRLLGDSSMALARRSSPELF